MISSERPVGALLKQWRRRRGRSQLDLALQVGVSTRHLSFVETERAKPSPEVVLALAAGLDLPLRERNNLLLAAGYAPRFRETAMEEAAMDDIRATLERLLAAHSPYPGAVLDRTWNVVMTNEAAGVLTEGLPSQVLGPPVNVFRLCLHPDGLARRTLNFDQLAVFLLNELERLQQRNSGTDVDQLAEEIHSYPNVAALGAPLRLAVDLPPMLLIPWQLRLGRAVHSYVVTLTKFATPQDVTLDELTIELFYPANDETGSDLRRTQ